MKYKVGDKVRIRKDLVLGKRYGRLLCLLGHETDSGKIFTIKNIRKQCDCYYRLNGSSFWWTEKMFEDVDEMNINITAAGKIVTAQMGDKYGVAICSTEDEFDIFVGARLALERLEKQCKPYGWLNKDVRYYFPQLNSHELADGCWYKGSDFDKRMIERGLVFKTREEAIEAAKKMLAVLKKDEDDD